MFEQIRARSGAALAAILVMLAVGAGRAPAAEMGDFAGAWATQQGVNVEAAGEAQTVTTVPGRLELERSGLTMSGTLTLELPDGEAQIPIQGATLSAGQLAIQFRLSNEAGDTSLDAIVRALFGDLGMGDQARALDFKGSLDVVDGQLSGRVDAEGFAMPGIVDALFIEISGARPAAEPEAAAAEGEAGAGEEPSGETAEGESMAGEAGEETGAEPEPELEALDQYRGEESAEAGEQPEEEGEAETPLHAGADAEVTALEADELADREVAVQMSAARAISEQERKRRERAAALRKLDRVHTYQYEMDGPSVEQVVSEASLRALVTTASRLYYGNYVILGRDLLEPYLRQAGERFIVHAKILDQEYRAEGGRRVRIEVTVDTDALYDDLESKHFIAEPNFRPVMAVAIGETLNGEPTPVTLSRAMIGELLAQVDMRVEDQPMGGLERTDPTADEEQLRRAREEAQRLGADILVAGSVTLSGPVGRVILFDQFYEVEGEMELRFIRADNNEVLKEHRTSFKAAAPSAEEAIQDCVFQMGADAVVRMTEGFLDEWQKQMLDKTDYRICMTGVDPKTVEVFEGELRKLSPEIEIYRKSMFADVAVLNINLPGAGREQVEDFLHRHRTPQFKVIPSHRGHYELRLL